MVIEQKFPIFQKGRMLKKDALDMLRDYAPEYASLLYLEYGDGVITGFRVSGCEKGIYVGPGILKDGYSFFLMKEGGVLDCPRYGLTEQIILRRAEVREDPDYRTLVYEMLLAPVRDLAREEFELGRFRLEKGAKLRSGEDYKDFNDLTTEYNTLNLIHVRYACERGSCLTPQILRLFGKGVLGSSKAEALDYSFAAACLNSPRMSAELLRCYLAARGRPEAEGDNPEWYKGLKDIYATLVSGDRARRRDGGPRGKTLID